MATVLSKADAIKRGVRLGDRGPLVIEIRAYLARVGFPPPARAPDQTVFDNGLQMLVMGFQRARGFQPTGVVDPATWAALAGTPGKAPSPEASEVSPGTGAPPVAQLVPSMGEGEAPASGFPLVKVAIGGALAWFAWKNKDKLTKMFNGLMTTPALPSGEEFDAYGAEDETEEERAVRLATAREKRAAKRAAMTEAEKEAESEKRSAQREAKRIAYEREELAKAMAIARARESGQQGVAESLAADRARKIARLISQGYTRGEAEMRVGRELISAETEAFGPKDIGARAEAVLMRRLQEQGAMKFDPTLIDPSLIIDPEMPKAERQRLQNKIQEARARYLERLRKTGLGPVSEPGLPGAKVKASLRRVPSEIYSRSITEERALARGLTPSGIPAPARAMSPTEAARLELTRQGIDTSGRVITLEVDPVRYQTDRAYMLETKDAAVQIARLTDREVQLRPAGSAPVLTRGPKPEIPASFVQKMRVNPDDPGGSGARGGETYFRPSSVVTTGPRESSLNILFKYDPKRSKAPKLGGYRRPFADAVTDARIDAPAELALKGDCVKAVKGLFPARGLAKTDRERTHYNRVVLVVQSKCRPELEEVVGELVEGRQRSAALSPEEFIGAGLKLTKRPQGKERSGAQKRRAKRLLNPLKPESEQVEVAPAFTLPGEEEVAIEMPGERVTRRGRQRGLLLAPSERVYEREGRPEVVPASRVFVPGADPRRYLRPPGPEVLPAVQSAMLVPSLVPRPITERDVERLIAANLMTETAGPGKGGTFKAERVYVPADPAEDPYYFALESPGKGRAPVKRKKKLKPEQMARLPKPIAVVRKKDGSAVLQFPKLEGIIWDGNPDPRADSLFDPRELRRGMKTELEHTRDWRIAGKIAKDHLLEHPDYYRRLLAAGL